jgi:hypothetical protein
MFLFVIALPWQYLAANDIYIFNPRFKFLSKPYLIDTHTLFTKGLASSIFFFPQERLDFILREIVVEAYNIIIQNI